MNTRQFLAAFVLVATTLATLSSEKAYAQLFGRLRIRPDEYRVKVLNQSGQWLRVRMIGAQEDASLRVGLRNGSWWRADLIAGQRVLVAWDHHDDLVLMTPINVDRRGTLCIPRLDAQLKSAHFSGGRGASMATQKSGFAGFPVLEIEDDAPIP